MAFLLQLAAVLIAGLVVAGAWTSKVTPSSVARAIVVLAVAFGYVAFWGHVWQNGRSFWQQREAWKSLTPTQAALAGVPPVPGLQSGFAEWIRGRIQRGERFYLVPSPTRDDAVYQWFTYRLLPNLSSEEPEQSDWLIFYGTSPQESGLSRQITGAVQEFSPGYSMARTRHAA
jgi:hypothetical protein